MQSMICIGSVSQPITNQPTDAANTDGECIRDDRSLARTGHPVQPAAGQGQHY